MHTSVSTQWFKTFSTQNNLATLLLKMLTTEVNLLHHLSLLHLGIFIINRDENTLLKQIKQVPNDTIIDSDDYLSDRLDALFDAKQQIYNKLYALKSRVNSLNIFFRAWKQLSLTVLMYRLKKSAQSSMYLQTLIREHDADASPLSGEGPFSDMDKLFHSLKS